MAAGTNVSGREMMNVVRDAPSVCCIRCRGRGGRKGSSRERVAERQTSQSLYGCKSVKGCTEFIYRMLSTSGKNRNTGRFICNLASSKLKTLGFCPSSRLVRRSSCCFSAHLWNKALPGPMLSLLCVPRFERIKDNSADGGGEGKSWERVRGFARCEVETLDSAPFWRACREKPRASTWFRAAFKMSALPATPSFRSRTCIERP